MLKHFVVTRLGIGIHNESWFRSALGLFEAITYPSLRAQTCQDFHALLLVDKDIPPEANGRLSQIVGGTINFHVVQIDLTAMHSVRHGCFDYVWDCCQDYLLANRLIVDPFDYIVTSVLDGDDAWHRETIALVNKRMMAELPGFLNHDEKRMTWLRHTGGMCLTFPTGLRWFAHHDRVIPMQKPFHSMSIFVVARFSSGISACSSRHGAWPSYCEVLGFKTLIEEENACMWVYTRHDRAEVQWDAQDVESDPSCTEQLHSDFGINFDLVESWRTCNAPRLVGDNGPVRFEGMPGTQQLDCYFRITALNRQIVALERQAQANPADPLLARQLEAREQLVKLFLEQAKSEFR